MTPLTSTLSLPAHTVALHAGDLDGDDRQELIAEIWEPAGDLPDRVKLQVLRVGDDGKATTLATVDLANRPALWDLSAGLWLLDRDGVSRIDATGVATRVVSVTTPLATLGATRPARWAFAHDLDGDERVELLVPSSGRLLGFGADGTPRGAIPFSADGGLAVSEAAGGDLLASASRFPALAVADVDGDGRKDLLLPSHSRVQVYFTGANLGSRAATMTLPVDLEPRETPLKPKEVRRTVAAAWFTDLDGDGKADLAVHRFVMSGGFFGATAEVLVSRGSGSSFAAPATLATAAAGFGVEPLDLDGDGDQDLVVREVDVGMGNLARALVARSVRVQLGAFVATGAAYATKPSLLRPLTFPLEPPNRLQTDLGGDVDGDGRKDLVTNDGEDRIRVYRGSGAGFEAAAGLDVALPFPPGEDVILVEDLTGDGRAEIVVFGPEERTATVVRISR